MPSPGYTAGSVHLWVTTSQRLFKVIEKFCISKAICSAKGYENKPRPWLSQFLRNIIWSSLALLLRPQAQSTFFSKHPPFSPVWAGFYQTRSGVAPVPLIHRSKTCFVRTIIN